MNFYLAKSRSFLLQRKWDDARIQLNQAYRYGADETSIVEGMAIISHETGIPSRSSTGRVLASLTAKPEALLLAGELLFIDGRYQEAWEILEPLFANNMFSDPEDKESDQRLRLRLGDIAFFLGDNQKAQLYWRGTFPDIRQIRMIQVQMITEGSHAWVKNVPNLRVIAENGVTQNSAEAMYLIGQVYSKYGTQLDAVELWADFIRTYPELIYKTDVLDMLGVVYQDRIRALHRKDHWMRIAKTHEVGWVTELQKVVEDTDVLIAVADAYDRLGLSERALYALISDFGIGSNSGFYAPEAELYLAQLYFKSNRYYETFRTLDLMKAEDMSPSIRMDVLFLESQAYLAEEKLDKAKELLEITARSKKYRTKSYVALGILARQDGDCESAITFLRPTILPLEDRSTSDPLAFLYLSQCLGAGGELEEATLVAKTLQEVSSNPDEIQHAQYLQAQYGGADTVSIDAIEDSGEESVWINLIEEQQKSNSFWKEFDEWQQSKD
jgi:tetratricopeptide (TPR) repeat protein